MTKNLNKIILGDGLFILKSFGDNSVDYTLTSPPYNNKTNKIVNKGKSFYSIYKDSLTDDAYYTFLVEIIRELIRVTKHYTFFNMMYNVDNKEIVCQLMGLYAFHIKDILIWEKPKQPAMCHNVLTHNYEFIFVFSKEQENRKYEIDFGGKGEYTTCFKEVGNSAINRERFSCKENFAIMGIQVARRIIKTFTKKNDIILDPFLGSGTTAVAAKQLGRDWIGIELSEKMIKIAKERISSVEEPLF